MTYSANLEPSGVNFSLVIQFVDLAEPTIREPKPESSFGLSTSYESFRLLELFVAAKVPDRTTRFHYG